MREFWDLLEVSFFTLLGLQSAYGEETDEERRDGRRSEKKNAMLTCFGFERNSWLRKQPDRQRQQRILELDGQGSFLPFRFSQSYSHLRFLDSTRRTRDRKLIGLSPPFAVSQKFFKPGKTITSWAVVSFDGRMVQQEIEGFMAQ